MTRQLTRREQQARRQLLYGETQKEAHQHTARLRKNTRQRARDNSLADRLRRYNSQSVRGKNFCVVKVSKNDKDEIVQEIVAKKRCKNAASALHFFANQLHIPTKEMKQVRRSTDQLGLFLCTFKETNHG